MFSFSGFFLSPTFELCDIIKNFSFSQQIHFNFLFSHREGTQIIISIQIFMEALCVSVYVCVCLLLTSGILQAVCINIEFAFTVRRASVHSLFFEELQTNYCEIYFDILILQFCMPLGKFHHHHERERKRKMLLTGNYSQ